MLNARERLAESLRARKRELADVSVDYATARDRKQRLECAIANLAQAIMEHDRRTARLGVNPHLCEVPDDAWTDEKHFSKAPQKAAVNPPELERKR